MPKDQRCGKYAHLEGVSSNHRLCLEAGANGDDRDVTTHHPINVRLVAMKEIEVVRRDQPYRRFKPNLDSLRERNGEKARRKCHGAKSDYG